MVALVPSEIVKELVQANEDIGETFATNAHRMMIKEQENVVSVPMPK